MVSAPLLQACLSFSLLESLAQPPQASPAMLSHLPVFFLFGLRASGPRLYVSTLGELRALSGELGPPWVPAVA